jgi:hypothetical protein
MAPVRKSFRWKSEKMIITSKKSKYKEKIEDLYLEGGDRLVNAFRAAEAARKSYQRATMTCDQREKYNSSARLRMKRYR